MEVEVEVGWGERQDHRLCLNVAGEHGKSILYVIVVRQCLVVIVVFRCQRSPLRNLLRKGVVSSFSCISSRSITQSGGGVQAGAFSIVLLQGIRKLCKQVHSA